MSTSTPPGWHPDPFRRFQHRYWDGAHWTAHVSTHGQQWTDPPVADPAPVVGHPPAVQPQTAAPAVAPRASRKVQAQLARAGALQHRGHADESLFHQPVLALSQKGKLIERRAEYSFFDQHGRQLATVRGRWVSSRVQVFDLRGRVLLDLRRELSLKGAKVVVTGPAGARIGRISPSVSLTQWDRDFKLEGDGGVPIGEVHREDRKHNSPRSFSVSDARGDLVAEITKTRAGLLKEAFTKADDYVVRFIGEPAQQLRQLSAAVAIVIDTKFHQR